jgi:NTE family protein
MDIKRKTIGLTLGSGGIRGFAHIGVIKTLIKHQIPIDAIVGASAGSLIGGLYLALGDIEKVEHFALSVSYWELASIVSDFTWSTGIIRGEKIYDFLEKQLHGVLIESLPIPFAAVATDIKSGSTVSIRKGKLSTAIIASCAVPTIVSAVPFEEKQLVDGGTSDPVPVDVTRSLGVDITVGVNLDAGFFSKKRTGKDEKQNPFLTGITTLDLLRYHLGLRTAAGSDVIITPKIPKTSFVEMREGKSFIQKGIEATELVIPDIRKRMENSKI